MSAVSNAIPKTKHMKSVKFCLLGYEKNHKLGSRWHGGQELTFLEIILWNNYFSKCLLEIDMN